MITLEGAQAGLSWSTILAKRAGYRAAFAAFDPAAVAAMTPADEAALVAGPPAIVRHKGKVASTVANAAAFGAVAAEFGSFDAYLHTFFCGPDPPAGYPPPPGVVISAASGVQPPASTAGSARLAADLKRRGFRFFGTTTAYAYMQAVGVVNDHDRRLILITGGNGTIAAATAVAVARRGAEVVLGCRRPDAAAATVREIRAAVPTASVRSLPLDLASPASVAARTWRRCCGRWRAPRRPAALWGRRARRSGTLLGGRDAAVVGEELADLLQRGLAGEGGDGLVHGGYYVPGGALGAVGGAVTPAAVRAYERSMDRALVTCGFV
ncbi:hypothetical protein I4F81_010709 [Pyropia yezoensis]|uniref:Uncharacterized protein n=1 Tax=Pyropia yezoensis TaxID=2788 RepID=A0ACC3CDC8_PYRYE|nr:hypothetical protein I4F81_010709 [Neopyropia yezoensis]